MSIHGIHHDAMTAQAQYAEWLRRLQGETRAKIALKTDEAEEDQEASADDSEQEPEEQLNEAEEPEIVAPPEDDGHLRSFA